jgi:hypothetical protein
MHTTVPLTSQVVRILDRVGARLTSALARPIGGRITVRVETIGSEVVLAVRTARPGSWTRALQHVEFDNLLSSVSNTLIRQAGTLEIAERPFGRLTATVRIERRG